MNKQELNAILDHVGECQGSLSLSSTVWGYHAYKDIWDADEGETLSGVQETSDQHDPYTVVILKDGVTVGPYLERYQHSVLCFSDEVVLCRVE